MDNNAVDSTPERTLEPFSVQIRWTLPSALPVQEWAEMLEKYLNSLALRCEEVGPSVIGHIKALAVLPEKGFLRGSALSTSHPADVEVGGDPALELAELDLTLNIMVYSLPHETARRLAKVVAESLVSQYEGEVSLQDGGDGEDKT